uniref:Zgc:163014 n=1 Tax=Oncorhynchus kisutch TaxID=8019 RepID=A0A8C7F7X0_ONCKI
MGRLHFFVLWSLNDAPRQFISKSNRQCHQVHVPLPLPKQLVVFSLGEWRFLSSETTISVDVLVSQDVKPQRIGTLSDQTRCLTWEGDWNADLVQEATEKGRRGVYGKVLLTVCGEVWFQAFLFCTFSMLLIFCYFDISVCPSKRWSHTMCLSDPETAIVIGGEASDQTHCEDSLWKLEIDNDFWFPMNSPTSGPVPPCAHGHSATYDPDSKVVYVYGGLREGQRYSDLYILNTLTWKWKLVTARGDIPMLAYHSATIYKKELFVFGGVHPSRCPGGKVCSNALYIFNPEFELWYQPIVEGDRPLPRFGHTTTLLSNQLLIFGGRKTATYLNDLHILDLGFMEYTAVKYENMPPLPRGYHAALPVSDNRMLVSGGCSAVGALQDVHIFNTDTSMWHSVVSPLLCARPRAGHSVINLGGSVISDADKQKKGEYANIHCTLLVFGGSDCAGTFYNNTVKCTVEIPVE